MQRKVQLPQYSKLLGFFFVQQHEKNWISKAHTLIQIVPKKMVIKR